MVQIMTARFLPPFFGNPPVTPERYNWCIQMLRGHAANGPVGSGEVQGGGECVAILP